MRLDATKAEGQHIVLNWNFSDSGKRYILNLENSALTYSPERNAKNADATLTLERSTLDAILAQQLAPKKAIESGLIKIEGNPAAFGGLLALIDNNLPSFELVAPNPPTK